MERRTNWIGIGIAALAVFAEAKPPLDPLVPGIHPLSDTEVLLCLEAPGKSKVNAVGDFNDWTPSDGNLMAKEGDLFWIAIGNLTPGKEYIFQYWLDGGIKVGDPYAEKIVDFAPDQEIIKQGVYPGLIRYTRESDGPASVFRAGVPAPVKAPAPFVKPAPENLLIYETLVRDFTKSHTFREMRDSLAYFKRLGVNAIELMPVMEFENNISWGYNPSYMFAVDKYYGPAEDLKALVQAAHEQGMAVILDIVLNHAMGQSPLIRMYWDKAGNKLMNDNPYANATPKHDYNVGFDLNYASGHTLSYYKKVLRYWLEEFHVDGYRIDLSKGLTQKNTLGDVAGWGHLDTSRVRILGELAAAARTADPDAYLILEHFADNDEETLLATKGFLLWGNSSFDHGFAMEGRTEKPFGWVYYKNRGWNNNRLVSYMESHDEERMAAHATLNGLSGDGYDVKTLETALERAKMAALFLFGIPGPKMMWEWGEWGDNRPKGTTADERMGPKPLPEDYRKDPTRVKVWHAYANLLHFRGRFQEAFKDGAFTWNPNSAVRTWKLMHASLNAFAVGNFGVNADKVSLTAGTWYDFFSREKFTLASAQEIALLPGEYHLFTDKAVFADQEKVSAFPVPKSLNPQPVTVGLASRQNARASSPGLRLIRNGRFLPEVANGAAGRQDIQGREIVHRP